MTVAVSPARQDSNTRSTLGGSSVTRQSHSALDAPISKQNHTALPAVCRLIRTSQDNGVNTLSMAARKGWGGEQPDKQSIAIDPRMGWVACAGSRVLAVRDG